MNRKAKYGGQGLSRPPNGQEITMDEPSRRLVNESERELESLTPKDVILRHETESDEARTPCQN